MASATSNSANGPVHDSSVPRFVPPRSEPSHTSHTSRSLSYSGQYGAVAIRLVDSKKMLETKRQRFQRYLSLAIVIFSMLVSSIGFSMIFGSIWPYYEKVDDSASKSFLGLIVGAFSLGQLIFAPFFGIWSNYRPISEPWIMCMMLFICGNMLYVFADAFEDIPKWILLVSRFIVGVGAADITIIRSYCSTASLEEERITVMSFLSAMQALGFILGPALALLFQPLGEGGYEWNATRIYFNLYTGPGFLGIFLSTLNIVLIVFFFKEFDVHNTKTKIPLKQILCCSADDNKKTVKKFEKRQAKKIETNQKHYDRIAAFVSIFLYFIIYAVFALGETLLSPLAQDEYAWSNKDATLYVNIIFAANAVSCVFVVIGTRFLAKQIQERIVLLGGLLTIIVGLVIWMPYGPGHPDVEIVVLRNSSGYPIDWNHTDQGCDFHEQSWCLHLPKIHLSQFVIGLVVFAAGYCISSLICQTIISKILGPWPQGLMMGFLSASGCMGRILGPSLLAMVYHVEGPLITFLICIGLVVLGVITTVAFYTRLVPYSVYEQKKKKRIGYVPVNSDNSSTSAIINSDKADIISTNSQS